eukprot:SM000036S13292  [mRNA]  locus=s36:390900:395912:+ [translate_table: standard]
MVVQSSSHLQQVLAECESQRQVGETLLNDTSSRSHQIIRLTVESCPRETATQSPDGVSGQVLLASLNLVDLAGSERVSQTLAEGARLKEGGHINKSLLTLGQVIRKLSDCGWGNMYRTETQSSRASCSTRGNARTAIVCTMSPALSHVDHTRNTLSFARQAKEVTNSAQINLVVSDKVLVKQLQREVERLKVALLASAPANELWDKTILLQKLEMEKAELESQRDAAQAHVKELTKALLRSKVGDASVEVKGSRSSKGWSPESMRRLLRHSGAFRKKAPVQHLLDIGLGGGASGDKEKDSPAEKRRLPPRRASAGSRAESSLALVHEIRKLEHMQDELGEEASSAIEALQKEIECLRLAQLGMNHDASSTISRLQEELKNIQALKAEKVNGPGAPPPAVSAADPSLAASRVALDSPSMLREELSRLQISKSDGKTDAAIASLEEKLASVQLSLDNMCGDLDNQGNDEQGASGHKSLRDGGSSLQEAAPTATAAPAAPAASTRHVLGAIGASMLQGTSPEVGGATPLLKAPRSYFASGRDQENAAVAAGDRAGVNGSAAMSAAEVEAVPQSPSGGVVRSTSVDVHRMQSLFKTAAEENIKSIRNYVTELKERVLELEASQKPEEEEPEECSGPPDFEQEKQAIIELWSLCQVSLLHRSQFYLLVTGAKADQNYVEVEHRRLLWLQNQMLQALEDGDGEPGIIAASTRQLKRERDMVAKRLGKKFSKSEREVLYAKWGISPTTKRRKVQLAARLWSDPANSAQARASAELVAGLLGFLNLSGSMQQQPSREMFELSFAPTMSTSCWRPSLVTAFV